MAVAEEDPFDTLLNLEEQYYQEGYALGVADGSKAGRIEGRTFGLEKGFEKYVALGMLAGQCTIWQSRLGSTNIEAPTGQTLPPLTNNSRLAKNVETLAALVDVDTLAHENTEDAVAEFDERLKAARGKAKVIANIVGEPMATPSNAQDKPAVAKDQSNIEDFLASKVAAI